MLYILWYIEKKAIDFSHPHMNTTLQSEFIIPSIKMCHLFLHFVLWLALTNETIPNMTQPETWKVVCIRAFPLLLHWEPWTHHVNEPKLAWWRKTLADSIKSMDMGMRPSWITAIRQLTSCPCMHENLYGNQQSQPGLEQSPAIQRIMN